MSAGRVAVVVAAGVGDKPRSDAAEMIANGLSRNQRFRPPTQNAEWFAVPDRDMQPVDRFETGRGNTQVDIYEFWWADQSRFPGAMRSFVAAFFGLFLSLPSIGRTALRRAGPITAAPQGEPAGGWKRNVDYHLLGYLSWLVAVPVVALSAQLLATVGALAIAIPVNENSVVGALALGAVGVMLTAIELGLLWQYEQKSGRRQTFLFGCVFVAAAATICSVRLVERGLGGTRIELALADTVTALVAYPMRVLWLTVVAAIAVITVVLIVRLVHDWRSDRREMTIRRTVTALVTLGGPFGFAVLMAILSAAVGGAAQKVSQAVRWQPSTGGTPWCLTSAERWTLVYCPPIRGWNFGTRTLADAISPLVWAGFAVFGLVLVYLVVVLGFSLKEAIFKPAGSTPASRQAARISFALRTLGSRPAAVVITIGSLAAAYLAATAWLPILPLGTQQRTWPPIVAALLGGAVTVLFLLARALGISPQSLATDSKASEAVRLILDKPYDIATFLREPVGTANHWLIADEIPGTQIIRLPRTEMLIRFHALLDHVLERPYDKVVFVAHSQGTVLTVTMLHDPPDGLPERRCSLVTFGCPLRQLYLERFPSQYAWVGALANPQVSDPFVRARLESWLNLGTAGDFVGRTVFEPVPDLWVEGDSHVVPGGFHREDLQLGTGGHSAYWKSPTLYLRLAELIEA